MRTKGTVRVDPKELPMRWLFLDLNAYFASVEQAEDPSLRGRPVAVGATGSDAGTIIAASYEAKKFGIRTGTRVGEAKKMCPEIVLLGGRHSLYAHYHRRILDAAESVIPVDKVCSIDEMRFYLLGDETTPIGATRVARELKQAIRDKVAENMTCSIGIATNAYLAKVGTELQKPDGLVLLPQDQIETQLKKLSLRDFPGINRKMEARLQACGVFTSEDLLCAPMTKLSSAFGRTVAERWWHLLRGYDLDFQSESNKSLGNSHVLPPDLRNNADSRLVMKRLLHKACVRLRQAGLWTSRVSFYVRESIGGEGWHFETGLPPTQDAMTVLSRLEVAWKNEVFVKPIQVGLTFTNLQKSAGVTPSLFDDQAPKAKVGHAIDHLNQKFGKNSVFVASLNKVKHTAEERIAFQKTELMSEGKDDNVWINTYTGATERRL